VVLPVAILTLLPALVLAAAPTPPDDAPRGVRLTTSATVERIPLAGMHGPVECTVDALLRTIRLRPTKDKPSALLARIVTHAGGLCPTAVVRDGAVELTCRSRRFDAEVVRPGKSQTQFLDINELRGLPWRAGPDRAPGYFFDPWRVGIGQSCPGRADAARGECQLKQGHLLEAAQFFRTALSTQHRQMASLRLGDLALATGDPVTAVGWYKRVGSLGVFGQFAAGRLCELDGTCFGSTAEVRRAFDPTGMPEPMRAETLMRAARAEAYLGRMRSAVKIMADQIRSHGVASLCRESAELLCRRLLLQAMREAVMPPAEARALIAAPANAAVAAAPGAGGAPGTAKGAAPAGSTANPPGLAAGIEGSRAGLDIETPSGPDDGEEASDGEAEAPEDDTVHLTNLMQIFFALPSWDKGPLAVDLAEAGAEVALRLGAPAFAGNLLVTAAREVPDRRLSEHLLFAVEAFLRSGDVVRARVVAEYVEMRLGAKGRAGERWRVALKAIASSQEDDDEIPSELRAEIEKEIEVSLDGLKDARAVLEKARTVLQGVSEVSATKSANGKGSPKAGGVRPRGAVEGDRAGRAKATGTAAPAPGPPDGAAAPSVPTGPGIALGGG
jgi:hypothetical protein